MPRSFRVSLVAIAALCGSYFAMQGIDFSLAVEPEHHSAASSVVWFMFGAVLFAPLWVPAVIPARYARTLAVFRRIGALGALVFALGFGTIVTHNIGRSISGLGVVPDALFQGLVLSLSCVAAIVLLLWSDLGSLVKGRA